MLRYNRNRARGRFFPLFSPRELFYGSVPGAWYDPTDLSTMFQDSTGTTPVTAVEQPVGLILDKSQGLALGSELVTNGDFSSGASWVLEPGWAIGAGLATKTAGIAASIYQPAPAMVQGRTYLVTFTVSGYTAGILYPVCRGTLGTGVTANGTYTQALIAGATAARAVEFFANATFAGSLDNVTVRELAGNHASQSTAVSRPTYRARYNLLTFSEQIDNGAWTKSSAGTGSAPVVTPNAAVAPDGTLTADSVLFNRGAGNAIGDQSLLSQTPTVVSGTYTQSVWLKAAAPADVGKQLAMRNVAGSSYLVVTLTADWVRYTRTETGSLAVWDLANRGTITTGNSVTALIWGAQLLTAADVTATGNAYQRIAAATVYDTAPIFRPYLAFDGVDDSLSTAAINFTSTDKMTVFAGVTKSSDSATSAMVELSAASSTNQGSFATFCSSAAGANYVWRSYGTVLVDVTASPFAAPITNVTTGIGNISGDIATLRVNGVQAATSTADQGAGNFGNYPLFIGRRNNASLPLNGRIYSLIVRGAASSTTEIIDTETWVNARTGGY